MVHGPVVQNLAYGIRQTARDRVCKLDDFDFDS